MTKMLQIQDNYTAETVDSDIQKKTGSTTPGL